MTSETEAEKVHVPFTELMDLAAELVGGRVLFASDDFFAEKENLLKPGRGLFIPGKFTDKGKWMDGWESRRKRTSGHDACVVKLGIPGVVRGVDVDTHHFLGNFPESFRLEGCEHDGGVEPTLDPGGWTELIPRTKLRGDSRNLVSVQSARRWTHLRLAIHPDGGVARFRVHGEVLPERSLLLSRPLPVDLASAENGGRVVACNDAFFGPRDNLLLPGRATNMGEGWETRRKRGPGNDWIVIRLALPGWIDRAVVDTHHFKGNYPDRCSLEGTYLKSPPWDFNDAADVGWKPLLRETKLEADQSHTFEGAVLENGRPVTHVRLSIYPDGGVSRLRLFGRPE